MTTVVPYDDLLDVPWREGGREATPGGGLDCWGVVKVVRSRLGLETPDPFAVGSLKEAPALSDAVLMAFAASWEHLGTDPVPDAGDVAVFDGFAGRRTHAVVGVGGGMVLHATPRDGVMCVPWARLRRHAKAVYRSGAAA